MSSASESSKDDNLNAPVGPMPAVQSDAKPIAQTSETRDAGRCHFGGAMIRF
jgi:hypothetical protein